MEELLDPINLLNEKYAEKFVNTTEQVFNSLVEKSNINIDENKKLVGEVNTTDENLKNVNKELNKQKTRKGLLIALIIVLSILIIVFIMLLAYKYVETLVSIIVSVVSVIFIVISAIGIKSLNPKIRQLSANSNDLNTKINELKNNGISQMMPLINLMEYNIANKIINECVDILKMDDYFTIERLSQLQDQFGFNDVNDINQSKLGVQSGTILGNPFILYKTFYTQMEDYRYQGTLTIHWTTTRRDSEGHLVTEHHSETLYAYVTKPRPVYWANTCLCYGNDAAPNLSFSRQPQKASSLEGKAYDSFIKKTDKELDKLVQKDIDPSDGSQFTRLHNAEFEGLFHAYDRDNEVQFRLLFTPLAQRSMVNLLRDKKGFGDDFSFYKRKKLNFIYSAHSNNFDYNINPANFISFDFNEIKDRFMKYETNYIKCIYYDLAPLLSIPLYQQTKTINYIYEHDYEPNYNRFVHEMIVNSFKTEKIKPNGCDTNIINKTRFISKDGAVDNVEITSYGYHIVPQVTYVSTYGGDGRYHDVPVHWNRYDQVISTNICSVAKHDLTRMQFKNAFNNDIYVNKGNLMGALGENASASINDIINKIKGGK